MPLDFNGVATALVACGREPDDEILVNLVDEVRKLLRQRADLLASLQPGFEADVRQWRRELGILDQDREERALYRRMLARVADLLDEGTRNPRVIADEIRQAIR